MRNHDDVVKTLMDRPGVKAELERIEHEEGGLVDALLKARHDSNGRWPPENTHLRWPH